MTVKESKDFSDTEVIIQCPEVDDTVTRVIQQIHQMTFSIIGFKDDTSYSLISDEILYIESVDNKTFLYDAASVYESNLKLYELEVALQETRFMRISKHLIVNLSKVERVKALLNGRFEAYLSNGEKVIINRHYVKVFKQHFIG